MKLSLLAAAEEVPRRIAVVEGEHTYTFDQLRPWVSAAAQQLASRLAGVKEPRVALVGHLDLATLVQLYALFELALPVLLLHPRWSTAERRRAVQAGKPSLVIEAAELPLLGEALAARPEPEREACLAVVYTSGSSDRPQGVELSRRAFIAAAAASAANLGWRDEDRWLLGLPLAHVGGLSVLTRCLIARRTVVLVQPGSFEVATYVAELARQKVTLASVVPTMLYRILRQCPVARPPASLRAVLVGGAAAPASLMAEARLAGWPVLATYGSTETCSQVATERLSEPPREAGDCGPPLAGIELRLGPRQRIEVRGDCLMSAYFPSGERPFTDDGWLITGDAGRLDGNGSLQVLGRLDDVIVSGGENIHPEEVEAALLEHPGIAAAVVFGVDDSEWGQRVAALLVADAEPLAAGQLRQHLRQRLATFKQPRQIQWVAELPQTAAGKVSRRLSASLLATARQT